MPNYYLTKDGRSDIGKYSPEVREVAFELWLFECDRDPNKVAARLREDDLWRQQAGLKEGDVSPSDDSIRRWVMQEDWPEEANRRMRQMAPKMLERGAVALVYGSAEAVNTVLRLTKGAAAGERWGASEKIALDAAKEVLGMVYGDGLQALVRPAVDDSIAFRDIDTMSMDELNDLEKRLPASSQ
jgi:hypothetical protein